MARGDDGQAAVHFLPGAGHALPRLAQHRHLAVDARDFRHLGLELGIALFQLIAQLVRLDRVVGEDLAHRSLGQFGQARVPRGWTLITGMRGQQPRCPQLVRIAQLLRLLAGQRHQPGFASGAITGSRPVRGRSSSASITPSSAARSRQRVTV